MPAQAATDWFAPTVVPFVEVVQLELEFIVNPGALEQLLFDGGVTHVLDIVNVPVVVEL